MLRFNKIDDDGNERNIEDRKEDQVKVPVPVRGDNGKWGYKLGKKRADGVEEADLDGEWRIKPKYDKAWSFDGSSSFAQVKVDEEKSYIEYNSVNDGVILREELGPAEKKYPTCSYRDHATYGGPNFIKTTKGAETYLISCKKPRTKEYFYQRFEDAWFDYNDVSEILAKAKSKFTHDHIPNWGMTRYKTMNGIIAETEVWLITDEDAKRGLSIQVRNRFTGKEERLTIPAELGNSPVNKKNQDPRQLIGVIKDLLQMRDRLKREQMNEQNEAKLQDIEEKLRKRYKELWGEDERSHTDWMGCYIPRTGTILIKIDRVDEAADLFGCPQDLLFQKVLLHEFIHAALDLWPRDAAGNISSHKGEWKWKDADGESFNEESIDNAIVLKLYKGTPGYRDVKGFIETQPYYYRRAVELYESKLLPQLLEELIAYKISAPVSTTPSTAKGGKYTYYVNDHIVAIGKRTGIGAAAYEVFSIIIDNMFLVDVLTKYGSLKLVGLPLVIDVNAYNKSPNQKRYYKVPVKTKDGKDIYLCSQWYDGPLWNGRHYALLRNVVNAYPALFPGGIDRK